ncbi:outer membrane beta-barrel protein [Microbulbifer harenosus]|uniref:Outer membrane protein OmpA-like transmembrane domain-containing protein n=1 Tax=Microbulbifer harenosus TaxID=2576840 RepID=A0ABY2UIW1_9GAMM|nr:outer membrane beta-barrel protein [Microbulbifer harenosus]TLM77696.1 hypothetical protein FDY93_08850 [Microbulbifer harenosus]
MYKVFIAAIAASASISANAQVSDQSPGFLDKTYLRSSIGVASLELDEKAEDFTKDRSFGFSVVGGYQYNRYIAFELGLYDIGESDTRVDYEYGDLELIGQEGRVQGTMSFAGRALGASVRVHTDMQQPFYVGFSAGYQYWRIATYSNLIQEYTYDPGFFYEEDSEEPPVSGIYRYEGTRSENGQDPFYGVFAVWNAPIGELGLEYTQFAVDGDRPALLTGSYTFRF